MIQKEQIVEQLRTIFDQILPLQSIGVRIIPIIEKMIVDKLIKK